jgi:hypothetical protein
MSKRKTWREKLLESRDLPKVEKITASKSARWGKGTYVVPAPVEVDELMRRVPKGKLTTIDQLRSALAKKHSATIGCPITTGIFAWIAAHAAAEDEAAGKKRFTPYWRTLKTGGEVNPKYPGGIADLTRRLAAEGHRVFPKGKRFFVADYQDAIVPDDRLKA